MPDTPPPNRVPAVLFVCLGNICRSPAAEGVFLHLLGKRHLTGQIRVDSAGTYGGHAGEEADPRMRQAARKRGITLTHRARQVTAEDLNDFDFVVAMDHTNHHNLRHLCHEPKAQLRLMGEFLPGQHHHIQTNLKEIQEVPDPYYGGADGFEKVLDMLEHACPLLLKAVLHARNEP